MLRSRRFSFALFAFALCVLALPAIYAADGFSASLSSGQRSQIGLDRLTADELTALNSLVSSDLATARQLKVSALANPFSLRHSGTAAERAGLQHLSKDETAQLNELVATTIATQPVPRERPRLADKEVVSLKRRMEVHGGASFTYGWAKGGRNYREVGAWTSYFDPETGFGLAFGVSRYSGDVFYTGYPYGYDGYGYGYGGYGDYGYGVSGLPGDTVDLSLFHVSKNWMFEVGFSRTELSRNFSFDGDGTVFSPRASGTFRPGGFSRR